MFILLFLLAGTTVSAGIPPLPPLPPLPPVPEVCDDTTWRCVTWKKYCDDPQNRYYMKNNCKRTCGWCAKCVDSSFTCQARQAYCFDSANKDWMKENCNLTCGYCIPYVAPTTTPPPPTPTWKVTPAGQCGVPKVQSSRIINGVDAKKGAWPWQVLIRFNEDPHCGGTIISPFWVVTAAHCLADKELVPHKFKVVVGEHDFDVDDGTELSIDVSKVMVHEKYNAKALDYDIGLIKLARPVPFNKYATTACLPKKNSKLAVGTKCFITGWGKIRVQDYMHHKLQQAMLPIADHAKCHTLNQNHTKLAVTDRMLCAGHGPSVATGGCHGDSGGPFVCQESDGFWYLRGSVSWGSANCNAKESYTVFADTAYFRSWIDNKISQK